MLRLLITDYKRRILEFDVSLFYRLPDLAGIYLFLDKKGRVLYVGKAKNLKHRVSSYFQKKDLLIGKTKLLVERIHRIKVVIVESEIDALLLEANYIKKYSPKFNVIFKDGKTYPLIKITVNEQLPKVLTVRRTDSSKALYFGPFPLVFEMRMVLRIVRRIFPYISANHIGNRICLYYHLGLCPCPVALKTQAQKEEYNKNISYIIKFLNGKSKQVIKELEKERDKLAKNEEFENAKEVQRKINAVIKVTSPVYKPFEYIKNPNLFWDIREEELNKLQEILKKYFPTLLSLERIECYDISNIAGVNATGSMIVFTDGQKDTNEYRRFRIRRIQKTGMPNDFAMMEEVLTRRILHKEWPVPNLIIIDGGKGQISSALKVLNRLNLNISVIGLAKREEIIITSDFKEIRLPKDNPGLKLIMRIRDEAHRFAITYHKKLRARTVHL